MEPAARISRVLQPCLLALVITSATLTGCSGSISSGAVTGTVHFGGHVTREVLALHAKVLAWRGGHQVAEAPLKRGSTSGVGTYRLTLTPGRFVLEVGASPPAGEVAENVVVIRAGATIKKDLHVVFHASPAASVTDTPLHPYALAVSSSGVLYVADLGRDEVLQRNPNGSFIVVAGNGQQGLSGDG